MHVMTTMQRGLFPFIVCFFSVVVSTVILVALWDMKVHVNNLTARQEKADNIKISPRHTECDDSKIYLSNELYDCNGLIKVKPSFLIMYLMSFGNFHHEKQFYLYNFLKTVFLQCGTCILLLFS